MGAGDLNVGLSTTKIGKLEILGGTTTANIGPNANTEGEILVDATGGSDSFLEVFGDLIVGGSGKGTLTLNGGVIDSAQVDVDSDLIVAEFSGGEA